MKFIFAGLLASAVYFVLGSVLLYWMLGIPIESVLFGAAGCGVGTTIGCTIGAWITGDL